MATHEEALVAGPRTGTTPAIPIFPTHPEEHPRFFMDGLRATLNCDAIILLTEQAIILDDTAPAHDDPDYSPCDESPLLHKLLDTLYAVRCKPKGDASPLHSNPNSSFPTYFGIKEGCEAFAKYRGDHDLKVV